MFISYSCEKDTLDKDVIKTLTINNSSHTFINDDGNPYCENTLKSQQDKHTYKLEMIKDVEYRISASQPNTTINQVTLTLVNKDHDTLAVSLNESNSKSCIILKSPETTNYYLIVSLVKRTNPQFVYRLFFEELIDNEISFSGLNWQYNGTWNIDNSNNAVLTNYDSHIYRHMKLISALSGNPDVSFVIQSESNTNPNFGVILNGSGGLLQFSEYISELTKYGYAFLAFNSDLNYTVIKLNSGSMSLDWGSLSAAMNFSSGIKVELKYNASANRYSIYLNNTYLNEIHATIQLQDFYILVQDYGEGTTIIKDFLLTN